MSAFRLATGALVLALGSAAPYQCAKEPDPNRRIEEDPAEAVYKLAERFKSDGNTAARTSTLKYLVERFPNSRFARMAEEELREMGAPAPPPSASGN